MAKNSKKPNYALLTIVTILMILGIVVLSSVSAPFSFEKYGNTYYFLKHQILLGLLPGLILGFLAYKIKLDLLKKYSPVLLLLGLIAMAAVFLPIIGSGEKGGASRWLSLGPLSVQPSEFLKIFAILYFATWLSARIGKEKEFQNKKEFEKTLGAFLIIIAMIAGILALQSNASTLGVIAIIAGIMYFSSKTPIWHTAALFILGLAGLFALIKLAPYRLNRYLVFLNSDFDPMNLGYQLKQSWIAIGSGGIKGVGFGMSSQKFGLLPQTIADSIFSVFSEENGFIGSVILIIIFLTFLFIGFKVAKRSDDDFCRLTALGITSWIVIQAFVNIGAMIGLLPLTGIPLPFISYGGSALVAELIGIGILLNISKQNT
jgi:cell division protein FtsW